MLLNKFNLIYLITTQGENMRTQRIGKRFIGSAIIIMALMLLLTSPALAYFVPSNGQEATLVLGRARLQQ